MMWVMILELWCLNEEKLQFSSEQEVRHDVGKELAIFSLLKSMFATKLERLSRSDEKKKAALDFEKTLMKATEGTDLLAKMQNKLREDEASPMNKADDQPKEAKSPEPTISQKKD